jgi:subtilisin family serine protease
MRHSRALIQGVAAFSAAALVAAAMAGPAGGASQQTSKPGSPESYLVLTKSAAGADSVAAKLRSQGAKVTSVNDDIGVIGVQTADANFRHDAGNISGVQGVAADRVIGQAPREDKGKVERENAATLKGGQKVTTRKAPKASKLAGSTADPLDGFLWGMNMIRADLAHTKTLGNAKVKVGVMDTGVDSSHPDISPNFDQKASRNFVMDIPTDELGQTVDGPCEFRGCVDPVGWDDNGHGTHVAGTIAAAANGFGVSGVAPKASIVEVRAGQDSGYFFTMPTLDALTYSGDAGLDVVNMSFYVDPWLYNCAGGAPEDSPEEAADQDTIRASMTRALNYAHNKGVTLVAADGNEHSNMAAPPTDMTSPDFPANTTHPRTIDNATCANLPAEGSHVLGVTALGPSGAKADYSNYTGDPASSEVEVSAPGGWFRDYFGTDKFSTIDNEILSAAPLNVMKAAGKVDDAGNVTPAGQALGVMKACKADGTCGYYQWLQGTSMASPHAAGVAALAIGVHGHKVGNSGWGMNPDAVTRLMMRTATDHACPVPPTVDYLDEGRDASFTATCVGPASRNGFYGDGIVSAWGVVR